jgi:hypothetical protein
MDKRSHYRTVVKQILTEHARYGASHGEIEALPVFDDCHD